MSPQGRPGGEYRIAQREGAPANPARPPNATSWHASLVRSRVLPAYFRRRVGLQIGAVLLILTALMQLFEMLDMTTEVLQRGLGFVGVLHYAALRTPSELVLSLPLAVLLGTVTALHSMARHLEITTARAAGVTLLRMFGYLLPLAVALAAVQFGLSERVLPLSENALKAWWNATAPPEDAKADAIWAQTDGGPLSIAGISPDGRRLRGVRLYERDAAGRIAARLTAAGARWDGRAWQLDDVSELRIEDGRLRVAHADAREWKTNLRPDEVLRLDVARPQLSSMMLADVIAGSRVGTQPLSYYRTLLYRSFTAPLGVFIELLLALPTACWLSRNSGGGREMLTAFVLGLAFLLADGIAAALGTSGRLAPLAAAVAAPLVFTLIGFWRLQAYERL